MKKMTVENLSLDPDASTLLFRGWGMIPSHWQTLITRLPCEVRILPPYQMNPFLKDRSKQCVYVFHEPGVPPYCAALFTGSVYRIAFTDRSCENFREQSDYHLMDRALRGYASALYHKYTRIRIWLEKNCPDENPNDKARLYKAFFIETFPKFCLEHRKLWDAAFRGYALMNTLDFEIERTLTTYT